MRYVRLFAMVMFSVLLTACVSNKFSGQGLGIQPGFVTTGLTKNEVLQHQAVFFDEDKTDISPEYMTTIELHARYLTQHPTQAVLLVGNTDVPGSRDYNIAIGQQRTQGVADVLMANGVLDKQIVQVSYGGEVPLACANSDDAHALNRRVDILYCQSSNCKQVAKNYGQTLCTYSK